ncbi:allophanate hydrolase [Solimonas aquatica]|uniref:Allophanate hydrolase n=1 Tax=Solimonas aquatica TaxID=489703 RepID=A0A1H9GT85_9GAMM|nr:allophanate hydrolase [Solimonas aquatica]SEQ53336.1 allophanate hydrolase [Solimonas aquatica]
MNSLPKLPGIAALQALYRQGSLTPLQMMRELLARIAAYPDPAVWISRFDDGALLETAGRLGETPDPARPLWGIPFAVKDNIDVAGLPTTAACPAYAYQPAEDAQVVARLRAAGALVIGKTNLDQFATGLNGTRSPYGAPRCVYNGDYISGGSSSGSAVAVAAGLVSFALGTDTAGSGRVPAGINNLVGLKPTRGWLSNRGLLPACRSLDCISVFALDVDDAECVALQAAGFDAQDIYSRPAPTLPLRLRGFRFGIPKDPPWYGDALAEAAFAQSCEQLRGLGAELVSVDFTPLFDTAALLYHGPWVAERSAAAGEFLRTHAQDMDPTVRGIVEQGLRYSAVDAFEGEYRRRELQQRADAIMASVDALLVPTAPSVYTVAQMQADPVELNSRLGLYTNFVNLLDWSALALPAAFRSDGLPSGITLIAPAWQDRALADFGRRWLKREILPAAQPKPASSLRVAVVGAHLRGMPLNRELTELGASFVEATHTSTAYRLYALRNTTPPKPGLARSGEGAAIEVELWDLPMENVGRFLAGVHAPLGIGSLELADGRWVKGFICEPQAIAEASDITHYGGWRAYRAAPPS